MTIVTLAPESGGSIWVVEHFLAVWPILESFVFSLEEVA
jgi:hypothetical protein